MPPAYEILLLNTAIPQIQAAQSGDTYVVPRDIAFSAALTLSAGTANGVPYLNGSKVLTSSSALQFDGSNLGLGVTPSAKLEIYSTNNAFNALQVRYNGSNDVMGFGIGNSNGFPYLGYNTKSQAAVDAPVYERSNPAAQLRMDSGSFKFNIAASGTAGNAISFTQAMTLDASGNLGVGQTSPATLLDVRDGVGSILTLGNTGTFAAGESSYLKFRESNTALAEVGWEADTNELRINNRVAYTTFYTANTERARITSSGDLLVGTTTPTYLLTNGMVVNNPGDVETYVAVGHKTGSGSGSSFFIASYNGGLIGNITQNGTTAVAYNTTSDYRLKDNQQPLTNSGAFIDALKPKTWEWKTDGSKGVGFIAHEVQEVSPGSVVGTKDAVDEDSKPIMQTMEYGSAEFIANIVAELQSLRARVAQLEAK